MGKRKVKFRLEKVFNENLRAYECVIHREGMSKILCGMVKKDITLVAAVASTMSSVFDSVDLQEHDNLEFELTVKVNRK